MSNKLRKPEDDVWFVHAPLKKENREAVYANPPSQIPYLNGVMDEKPVDGDNSAGVWFKETDSDFIRLSKLGGRQDLLVHKTKERSKEPMPYPRPAWWTAMLTDDSQKGKEAEKEPYIFEVPAWFAHNHKAEQESAANDPRGPGKQTAYPYGTYGTSADYEPIKEPTKFGQIRNYLHPVKVKNPQHKPH